MPVTVVVGGQYGSEGKGKVSLALAQAKGAAAAIRVGGTNSGHTAVVDGRVSVLRQLPTAALLPDVLCVLPAGSFIDSAVILAEVKRTELPTRRLVIDPLAM